MGCSLPGGVPSLAGLFYELQSLKDVPASECVTNGLWSLRVTSLLTWVTFFNECIYICVTSNVSFSCSDSLLNMHELCCRGSPDWLQLFCGGGQWLLYSSFRVISSWPPPGHSVLQILLPRMPTQYPTVL